MAFLPQFLPDSPQPYPLNSLPSCLLFGVILNGSSSSFSSSFFPLSPHSFCVAVRNYGLR